VQIPYMSCPYKVTRLFSYVFLDSYKVIRLFCYLLLFLSKLQEDSRTKQGKNLSKLQEDSRTKQGNTLTLLVARTL